MTENADSRDTLLEEPETEKRRFADGKKAREVKRAKFEAKQARERQKESNERVREEWYRKHAHFCTTITRQEVIDAKADTQDDLNEDSNKDLTDLIKPYLNLKESGDQKSNIFIAEGAETVRLLIRQCRHDGDRCSPPIELLSVLVKPPTLFDPPVRLLTDIEDARKGATNLPFRLLVGKTDALSEMAGFPIARGALACGIVPRRDETMLQNLLSTPSRQRRLVALDGICDSANMGAIIRCAAAFGIDAIVLSEDCCNAWYRRSIRVSMGYIFQVPIFRVGNLSKWIERLGGLGIQTIAAVVDPSSDLVLENMEKGDVARSWCSVMGSEGRGIKAQVIAACANTLRIGMVDGVDSLSVPIATGILLHGLRHREATTLS